MYYYTKFEDTTANEATVSPTSKFYVAAMLVFTYYKITKLNLLWPPVARYW